MTRELLEETGLHVRPTRLLDVWVGRYAEDATLNLVYLCEGGDDPVKAASDSAELGWFPLDALPDEMAFPHEREALTRARALTVGTPAS